MLQGFDSVFVDEATQATKRDGELPVIDAATRADGARPRVVMVGDPKQLPPYFAMNTLSANKRTAQVGASIYWAVCRSCTHDCTLSGTFRVMMCVRFAAESAATRRVGFEFEVRAFRV